MRCPFCQEDNDRVMDSRATEDGFVIRRRRQCLKCKRRYTTYERLEEASLKVVKKAGHRQPYCREKILNGLSRACWKRPVSDTDIEAIVMAVESEVYAQFDVEVQSSLLGEMVMEQLADLDQVAYVRFASVYREFTGVSDFVDELQPMLKKAERNGDERRQD